MIAPPLPIHVAHRAAVAYERKAWTPKLYRHYVNDHSCVRVTREEVRCRFTLEGQPTTVAERKVTVVFRLDVMVKRSGRRLLIWES
jgi:hypothetical protein